MKNSLFTNKKSEDDALTEMDRIIELCDSIRQMSRIEGRLQWTKFEQKYTAEQIEYLAKKLGLTKA